MSVDSQKTAAMPAAPISRTVIELPPADADNAEVQEIMARGNIPLLIGDTILAEIANAELNEGLEATGHLASAELLSISASLAENISRALETEDTTGDQAELAADAAALFVLCLRRNNVLDVDNIPACRVSVSREGNDAQLILAG